ncbi:MAG: hypothetical protein AAGK32_21475 [Actinomycetota bacterium]
MTTVDVDCSLSIGGSSSVPGSFTHFLGYSCNANLPNAALSSRLYKDPSGGFNFGLVSEAAENVSGPSASIDGTFSPYTPASYKQIGTAVLDAPPANATTSYKFVKNDFCRPINFGLQAQCGVSYKFDNL